MKLAFSILSHKEPDALFEKLLAYLNQFPDACIVVHHDYNKSSFSDELIAKYNLRMVTPYFNTRWGHVSKIPAIIGAFTKIKEVAPDFDWLISISPNCYPIKSVQEVLSFFENAKADYFMENLPLGLQYEGISKWHYQALFTKRIGKIPFLSKKGKFYWRHLRVPIDRNNTPFNDSMYPYCGSDWYFFNRKTVDRILSADIVNHPITKYIAKANEEPDMNASPDEILLQTFVRNQKDLVGSGNYYRYIDWENAKDWHPNTITLRHWDAIKQSDALFARKFDKDESSSVIKLIDEEILKNKAN